MDLSTIKRKLDTGQYQEPWQYVDDVWLMFNNAWLYNRKTSRVYKFCSKLAEVFEQEIDPVMQSLGYCCGRKVQLELFLNSAKEGVMRIWWTLYFGHTCILRRTQMESSEARSSYGSSIPGCPGVHSSICNKCPLDTNFVPFYPKISLTRIIKRLLSVLTTNLLAKSSSPYQTQHYMTVNAFIFNTFSFVFAVWVFPTDSVLLWEAAVYNSSRCCLLQLSE